MICPDCAGGVIEEDGSCDNCQYQVTGSRTPEPSSFASQFTSQALCIIVGPGKKTYYANRETLTSKIPYFWTMLTGSLQGKECLENAVTLDTSVDSEEAFEVILEYVYTRCYKPSDSSSTNAKCLSHSRVYLMAERLCMDDLKLLALEKVIEVLSKSTGLRIRTPLPKGSKARYLDEQKMDVAALTKILKLIYANTPDDAENGDDLDESGLEDSSKSSEHIDPDEFEDNEFDAKEFHTDKMRIVVSRYAASYLPELKKNKKFLELVKTQGSLARDLLLAAASGSKLRKDEIGRL